MCTSIKKWRKSASLILAAKATFSGTSSFNYKVVCLKRSSKSEFMPDTYVFPGGNLSTSDSTNKWLDLYNSFGFSNNSFDELKPAENIPYILQSNKTGTLPRHISLRICAIREAFEECGILLCKSSNFSKSKSKWASFIGGPDFAEWQHRVHDDPNEFLNLCIKYRIYPDILALKNWSQWMTPAILKLKFSTVFFLAVLDQIPPTCTDKREIQGLMWTAPDAGLDLSLKQEIMLPVPQYYEFSRLKTIGDAETLANFADKRSDSGYETFWPYRIKTKTGNVSILPGDDLYPQQMDPNQVEVEYMEELPDSVTQNRILHKSVYNNKIITKNLVPKCDHLIPYS